jgi:hypothetical protein
MRINVKPNSGEFALRSGGLARTRQTVSDPKEVGTRLSRKSGPIFREPRPGAILGALAWLVASACAAQTLPLPDDPPAETRLTPYTSNLPACANELVLAEIARKFWDRERDFWDSPLSLETFDAIRETGYRTRGLSFIPRRHCVASARFNDGETRQVIYTIGENLGFIGFQWGVEWCVVGLDRARAYAPACAAAGPGSP